MKNDEGNRWAAQARLPDVDDAEAGPLGEAVAAVGAAIARNPVLVGGATAFIVALSYVSANALWYQPHFHSGAFFATRRPTMSGRRIPAAKETTIKIERQSDAATPRPKPDPVVEQVQAILQSMNLYAGDVDGITGPNTRKAIASLPQDDGHDGFGRDRRRAAGTARRRRDDRRHHAEAGAAAEPEGEVEAETVSARRPSRRRQARSDDPQDPGRPEGVRQ